MSVINELIEQIENESLRNRIRAEFDKVSKQKKFGLVFEEHLPERTLLWDVSVKKGAKVAFKAGNVSELYTVLNIDGNMAKCLKHDKSTVEMFNVEDLVCAAEFGEPIYPYLKPLDSICNAPNSDIWHTLIEADNYHALQLLEYFYAEKVDCIYIDPPYNTGARDWKYNNDYVDNNDQYRHSKWLSMMEKRLRLAKKLMNPNDSVMIVTIDEKEYLHLGCLLEEMFPESRIQMVSSMINPANVARAGEFGRSGEYVFFVMTGNASPQRVKLTREWVSNKGRTHTGNIRWDLLKRSGTNAERKHSPNGFYPIYINNMTGKIEKVGRPLEKGISVAPYEEGCTALLPIRQNGEEGNWQWSTESFMKRMSQGRVKIGGDAKKGFTVYILKDGEYSKIMNGEFAIIGRGINNEIIVENNDSEYVMATPGDIWKIASHDATQYGSRLIGSIFGDRRFTFPKSLYAVKDCLYFFTSNKPKAIILDFFAGSGTTLHAVNLLNAEDGGERRCILVTNNEVSESERKDFVARGMNESTSEWQERGIARHVTWPRTVCSITGKDVKGNPLRGNYLYSGRPMSDGFPSNVAYFKLDFLDKDLVMLGKLCKEMLPVLWMKAGTVGACPIVDSEIESMFIFPQNRFAVLLDEREYLDFAERINTSEDIDTVFIVTDSETGYRDMIAGLNVKESYQLYRDYLDNFKINSTRR